MSSWVRATEWLGSALAVTEPEQAEAGPTALLVVILLGIGIAFLGRSMVKHIRRVPTSFDPPPAGTEESAPDRSHPADPGPRPAPPVS